MKSGWTECGWDRRTSSLGIRVLTLHVATLFHGFIAGNSKLFSHSIHTLPVDAQVRARKRWMISMLNWTSWATC